MSKILGLFTSIILIVFGVTLLFEDDSTTRESIQEHENETIIIHKKVGVKKITETIDSDYKKKYNLDYY